MKVGAREFKSHVGEYLKRVAAGEQLTVTRYGKVVAELLPPKRQRSAREMVDAGMIELGGRKAKLPPCSEGLVGKGPSMSDYIIEGRD